MPELPFPLPPLPTVSQVVFILIAVLAVVGSLMVVLARNLFHSALGLVAAFFALQAPNTASTAKKSKKRMFKFRKIELKKMPQCLPLRLFLRKD